MKKVYSRQEARYWFIENHSGSVICVSVIDRSEIEASCFPVADKFYRKKALLSKSIKNNPMQPTLRFCDKCIAKKVNTGKVPTINTYYPDMTQTLDFIYDGKCAMCGELSHSICAFPPMEKFITAKKTPIDEKSEFS